MTKINLLPEEVRVDRRKKFFSGPSTFMVVGIILILLVLLISGFLQFRIYQEESAISDLEPAYEHAESLLDEKKELEKEKADFQNKLEALEAAVQQEFTWTSFLDQVEKSIPGSVWLTKLQSSTDQSNAAVRMEGMSENYRSVGLLASSMQAFNHVKNVEIDNVNQVEEQDIELYEFEIFCSFEVNAGVEKPEPEE